jgi:hypothetical protein
MFEFESYTEEQVQEMAKPPILPEGEYNFEIVKAIDELHDRDNNLIPLKSKAGNPMMELTLKVWGDSGEIHTIKDWIVLTSNMMFKIRHLCETCGLLDLWNSEQLHASNLEGRLGKAKIIIQKGKEIPLEKRQDRKTHYDDRNSVQDYVKPKVKSKDDKSSEPFFDDDIKM